MADHFQQCYSTYVSSEPGNSLQLNSISVSVSGVNRWSVLTDRGTEECCSFDDVVYVVDKLIAETLQLRRPDLFFLHGAVVSDGKSCIVIAGPSGTGKSTLCWALIDCGYRYMSDELAPIDVAEMRVHKFARALGLKDLVNGAPTLPNGTINLNLQSFVTPDLLPNVEARGSMPLAGFVFLGASCELSNVGPRTLPAADAAALIYANSLNSLSHPNAGLATAAQIARSLFSYSIERRPIPEMCAEFSRIAGMANSDAAMA